MGSRRPRTQGVSAWKLKFGYCSYTLLYGVTALFSRSLGDKSHENKFVGEHEICRANGKPKKPYTASTHPDDRDNGNLMLVNKIWDFLVSLASSFIFDIREGRLQTGRDGIKYRDTVWHEWFVGSTSQVENDGVTRSGNDSSARITEGRGLLTFNLHANLFHSATFRRKRRCLRDRDNWSFLIMFTKY